MTYLAPDARLHARPNRAGTSPRFTRNRARPIPGWKRPLDLFLVTAGLAVIWPLLLVIALAVRCSGPGPVFFVQTRIGLNGQPFGMIKFRSMHADAEARRAALLAQSDREGICFKSRNDPRITRVGRFLRATRIDEIPQAWNVLKGEMSFVGPRPERPEFVSELEAAIPYYAERHMVKPGLTGWAQINYPYGASIEDARAKLEYDLYYAKNYTPFLDILILLQTIRVVLWPDGAR